MSADNWSDCPWCGVRDAWREDYEIGMSDGVFTVDYHGECVDGCRKTFAYKHREVVVPDVKKRQAMRELENVTAERDRLQRIIDEGAER